MTRQNILYLRHYYVDKQVFSWRAKKVQISCIITFGSRFSHDAPKRCKVYALIRGKAGFLMTQTKTKCTFDALLRFVAGFSHDAPKVIFDALLHGNAGFLMTRRKGAHLLQYYVEKQVFSWRTKNSYIWCIYTWWTSLLMARRITIIFGTF